MYTKEKKVSNIKYNEFKISTLMAHLLAESFRHDTTRLIKYLRVAANYGLNFDDESYMSLKIAEVIVDSVYRIVDFLSGVNALALQTHYNGEYKVEILCVGASEWKILISEIVH
jgi:hypothetical protein